MQGTGEKNDKLRGFRSKLALWRSFNEKGQLDMFPLCNAHSNSKLPGLITQHLKVLEERFNFYFPAETYAEFDWVLDPWSSSGLESSCHCKYKNNSLT